MDDLFPLLLFLMFILAPLIEAIRKKGKPPQPPPTRRPLPGAPPPRRSETEEVSSKRAETAATMIPDELWKILTGEAQLPRPAPPPPQQQAPQPAAEKRPWEVVYVPPGEEEDEEALIVEDVDVEIRRTRPPEPVPVRRGRSAITLEETPVIVSLETEPLTGEARHTAFHRKLAEPQLIEAPAERVPRVSLTNRAELQRAFILQEVLGRPRGLD